MVKNHEWRSPLEADDELCRLLGIVTARWSMMENAIAVSLGNFLNDNNLAFHLFRTTGSFRGRIDILRAVARADFSWSNDLEKFEKLLEKIYKAFRVRNRIIHSPFSVVVKDEDGEVTKVPFLWGGDMTEDDLIGLKVKYIGQSSPFENPDKVNAHTFSSHLEHLDGLMSELVDDFINYGEHLMGDEPDWRAKLSQPKPQSPPQTHEKNKAD